MNVVSRVTESVGGLFGGADEQENGKSDAEAEPQEESEASCFQCPDCEAVFIATHKDICSTCRTGVNEIPSALAETE